jgi:hypothetical protein
MVDFSNCNYEEALIQRLQAASREFLTLQPAEDEEARRILNDNTQALNRELTSYRKSKSDLASSQQLTDQLKRKIREIYVPKDLYSAFDSTKMRNVKDLNNFVSVNQIFFREVFPTPDRVLEAVSELDPLNFRLLDSEYPSISIRLRSGPISSAECDGLIKENGLDPKLFGDQVKKKRKNIFDLLEKFLSKLGIGIGIMGSFCALVEDVFALSKGQRDLTGNSAQFLGNFTNVLGLVNPKAGEVAGQVQELISLMTSAQQASVDVASNLQGALSTIAGSLGVVMKFADVLKAAQGDTAQESGIEVDWNLEAISAAILAADPKFAVILDITGKPLGDINQDGLYDANDSTALDTYIAETSTGIVKVYIEKTFLPYLNKNAANFSNFSNIPSASEPGSSMPSVLSNLSSAASSIGAGPGSGDFGLSKIIQTISIASSIASSIQSLTSGSKPVNIKNLFSQLDQITELGAQAAEGMFGDFKMVADDYKVTVEDSLKEAEKLAVDNKPKTAEISESNQQSLEDNVTKALETSAENSKNLGPRLVEIVNNVRNGIRQLAAVGVLEDLNTKLTNVVDQSAADLKSRVGLMSPNSIGNGFNLNMLPSFGKMAGKISQANAAVSEDSVKAMRNSVTGMVAQSSDKFRQKNKEEVEFVALRFCKLAAEIERMYREVTAPIEQMTTNFSETDKGLSSSGAAVTLRAVQAGALRLDTQARIAAMQQAGTIPANQTRPFVNGAGVNTNVPPQGTYPTGVVPPLPADYEFPSYEDAVAGRGGVLYAPGPSSRLSGPAGFITKSAGGGVDPEAMRKLYALARSWGQTVKINSAYRSPAANADADGAKASQHLNGTAFDCDINTYEEQVRFANLAYLAGFRGFGSYLSGGNTFIHIDLGPERDWAGAGGFQYYSLSGPPGAKVGR